MEHSVFLIVNRKLFNCQLFFSSLTDVQSLGCGQSQTSPNTDKSFQQKDTISYVPSGGESFSFTKIVDFYWQLAKQT
jgi:hypothetical protein